MYESFDHLTQKQLGEIFGVSSHQIGRWLQDLGLKNGSSPASTAWNKGFVKKVTLDIGTTFPVWHRLKTMDVLTRAGHQRMDDARPSNPEPPFELISNNAGGYEIVDANGITCIWLRDERLAVLTQNMLGLAADTGVLDRHLGTGE